MSQEDIILLVSKVCSDLDGVSISKEFKKHDFTVRGELLFDVLGVELKFEVFIPTYYPMTNPNTDNISITFRNTDLVGYQHVNGDGSVCVHPAKDSDAERKMKNEINLIIDWIKNYYIFGEEDERYEYLIHPIKPSNFHPLFFTSLKKKFSYGDCGTFTYGWLENNHPRNQYNRLYRLTLDDESDKWSESFHSNFKTSQRRRGLWCMIEGEPIIDDSTGRRLSVKRWSQLYNLIGESFAKRILKELAKKSSRKSFEYNGKVAILLGYNVPNEVGYEVNWDVVWLDLAEYPLTKRYYGKSKYVVKPKDFEVQWGKTVNSDYKRFFGRGKLNETLTNGSVLVIGCGALGSVICESLVRGGVRDLVIEDFDIVEQGNLCRANYSLDDVYFSKVDALKNRLEEISPFVKVLPLKMKINGTDYQKLEEILNSRFDLIMDASADPEVGFIFDQIDFKGHFFSVSITNHAQHLFCVSGKNVATKTNLLFRNHESDPATFVEGAGCGYPTFNASFNDINSLASYCLKKISSLVLDSPRNHCFVLSDEENGLLLKEYTEYSEEEGNQLLLVDNHLLDIIQQHLKEHYPKEFGGIFVGSESPEGAIISQILVPDRYRNGKTVFVREPKDLNERLKLIHKETKGRIVYLGEWHSHPNASPVPSATDRKAMIDISNDEKVNNSSPVLMIAGLYSNKVENMIYRVKTNQLRAYEQKN